MKKEKLTEELTEEVAGGAGTKDKYKYLHDYFESMKINVKCAKCGKEFKYYKDGPMGMLATELFKHEIEKRTCPSCGYVNSEKELGLRKK